jgi:DNA-binding phage protein
MDVKNALNDKINDWINSDKNRSFFQLARISGIAHPTLYRLVRSKNNPNLETAIKVVSAILPEKEAHTFINHWYPISKLLISK